MELLLEVRPQTTPGRYYNRRTLLLLVGVVLASLNLATCCIVCFITNRGELVIKVHCAIRGKVPTSQNTPTSSNRLH